MHRIHLRPVDGRRSNRRSDGKSQSPSESFWSISATTLLNRSCCLGAIKVPATRAENRLIARCIYQVQVPCATQLQSRVDAGRLDGDGNGQLSYGELHQVGLVTLQDSSTAAVCSPVGLDIELVEYYRLFILTSTQAGTKSEITC
jgi:hypothetical protein